MPKSTIYEAVKNARRIIAGVDEAGRGPLAGPVIAAAVVLDESRPIEGLADSKKLSANRREGLSVAIKERARCWALGRAEVDEIDKINILQASLLAMKRAVAGLTVAPDLVLVDGNQAPVLDCHVQTIIRGDVTVAEISAASILAKVARDREMTEMDKIFPGYGFSQHKGYPTELHVQAIRRIGVSAIHRLSFAPVKFLVGL
jgi:ribonuclease HII